MMMAGAWTTSEGRASLYVTTRHAAVEVTGAHDNDNNNQRDVHTPPGGLDVAVITRTTTT
jgi:hypothetical protein